ncbi:MAG: prepilin-type N-terminal cleavage/methylation domain-containing protein [Patescibacteria group bacterium]
MTFLKLETYILKLGRVAKGDSASKVSSYRFQAPRSSRAGFTLVETLVALTILLIGVVGPLSVAARNVSNSVYIQNSATATFLAQEGVEAIRNLRDNDLLNSSVPGGRWPTSSPTFSSCVTLAGAPSTAVCTVDSVNRTVATCGSSCTPLARSTSAGLFYQTGCPPGDCSPTVFTRTFTLKQVSSAADHELWLTVTVSWPPERANAPARSYILRSALLRN